MFDKKSKAYQFCTGKKNSSGWLPFNRVCNVHWQCTGCLKERPCKVGWAFLPSEVIWRGSLWRERRMKRFVHGGWGDWRGLFWAGEEIVGSLAKWGYWYLGCRIYDKSLKCLRIARFPKVEVNGFWAVFLLQFCVRIQDLGSIFRSDPGNKLDQLRFENLGL